MTHDHAAEHAAFTETEYARLLDMARERYQFCGFGEFPDGPSVVWRHDVDHSAHRALALARLESARGLRCVYHVLVTGRYYNVLELEVAVIFREIDALGHEIGLHFDMDAFGEQSALTSDAIAERAAFERHIVETMVGVEVRSMSFHNYVLNQKRIVDLETIGGMLNCSASALTGKYKYISDSNGIWRYERLQDVLANGKYDRLHVLTHPEWWTSEAMSPAARLKRIVDGRARANWRFYEQLLRRDGRHEGIKQRIGLVDAGGQPAEAVNIDDH